MCQGQFFPLVLLDGVPPFFPLAMAVNFPGGLNCLIFPVYWVHVRLDVNLTEIIGYLAFLMK